MILLIVSQFGQFIRFSVLYPWLWIFLEVSHLWGQFLSNTHFVFCQMFPTVTAYILQWHWLDTQTHCYLDHAFMLQCWKHLNTSVTLWWPVVKFHNFGETTCSFTWSLKCFQNALPVNCYHKLFGCWFTLCFMKPKRYCIVWDTN